MFASIRHYRFTPGSISAVTELVQQEFVLIVSSVPGFVSYMKLAHEGDEATSVSIYGSEAEAVESNRLAAGWVKRRVAQFVDSPV
jgi:hypothetical protein